jgi:hypothetical protein
MLLDIVIKEFALLKSTSRAANISGFLEQCYNTHLTIEQLSREAANSPYLPPNPPTSPCVRVYFMGSTIRLIAKREQFSRSENGTNVLHSANILWKYMMTNRLSIISLE